MPELQNFVWNEHLLETTVQHGRVVVNSFWRFPCTLGTSKVLSFHSEERLAIVFQVIARDAFTTKLFICAVIVAAADSPVFERVNALRLFSHLVCDWD